MVQGSRSSRLAGPIAARTLWANSNGNFVRVIDPIALSSASEVLLSDKVDGIQ